MHRGTIEIGPGGAKQSVGYDYLNHDPFYYFFRIKNDSPSERSVTVRVFLVPEGHEEDRRLWIEMDKFVTSLAGGQETVVVRADVESSVIRKPAVLDPDAANRDYDAADTTTPGFDGTDLTSAGEATIDRTKGSLDDALAANRKIAARYQPDPKLGPELAALVAAAEALKAVVVKGDLDRYRASVQAYQKAVNTLYDALIVPFENQIWCECGWPYSLLLPRGTAEGMPFKLLVMLTDWERDRVDGGDTCCGSLSYCGALDKYPDARPMGYPFDRPNPNGIMNTVAAHHNMACRTIVIKCGRTAEGRAA